MDDGSIDWERGWVAPDGTLPLLDDAWLPEGEWLQYGASDVVTLEQVRDLPALVLLGEPGSGKSNCLRRERASTKASIVDGEVTMFVDLGLATDARDLRAMLFEHPTFLAWVQGRHRLYLFLDALDEAKIQIRRAVTLLEAGFSECDMRRLVLRVTCRTADRPIDLETWLRQAFGDSHVRTLELAPLRMSETKAMAESWDVDPDRFIDDVINAGVAPLAVRPLSLKMLLRVFRNSGGLPDTLAALYKDALLLMAGEVDEERRVLRTLTDTAAFAVAARIAAATVLAGRDVIGEVDAAIKPRELSGGTELDRLVAAHTDVAVDEGAVREVIGTALFSARAGGVGWAHRTFGEYLAAHWLSGERLTDEQAGDLLLVDDGNGLTIAPTLRNVAGWLLGMRPSFQERLRPTDAVVLVYADPRSVPVEVRRALLPSLLDALDDHQLERYQLRTLWRRLAYVGIEDDLQMALVDPRRGDHTKQAAADAVAEMDAAQLIPTLVDLALDQAQTVQLRTSALYALRKFNKDVPLNMIRPLALEPQPGDVDDEIKGAALEICWPAAITAAELFTVLTPEKRKAYLGAYAMFLHGSCLEHLTEADDLLLGIRWALTLSRGWQDTRGVNALADSVVARAWPLAASEPAIAHALADLVELVTAEFRPVLTTVPSTPDESRESALNNATANSAIVAVLVERVASGRMTEEALHRSILHGLASEIDMDAVISRWVAASTPDLKAGWKSAIGVLARGGRADAIFDVKNAYPELYELVAWLYEPILIDSPEAERLRARHTQVRASLEGPPDAAPVDPSDFDNRVLGYLAAFADGDFDAFWHLLRPLFADDDGFIRDEQVRDDMTDTSVWRRMADETRRDLVDAAEVYLLRGDLEADRWLARPSFFRPAHAGLCALKLLFNERRDAFERLDTATWQKWAPVVLAHRRYRTADDHTEFMSAAFACVRAQAPLVARKVVLALLPTRLLESDIASARDRLGDLWDSTFDDALFAQLDRDDIEQHQILGVIESLLTVQRADALEWAFAHVSAEALKGDDKRRELALGLAQALEVHFPREFFALVLSIAVEDEAAARILLARLASAAQWGWTNALEPGELGHLFGLLDDLFPRELDSPVERSFEVTIGMHASMWRGRILERLVREGSPEAVAVIASLEDRYDEGGWIRGMRHRAQEQVRRTIWAPPAPDAIVRMGSEDARRHIPDAPALRRLVIGGLAEIAEGMRGTRSLAPSLWNTRPHRLPKDENEISNMLAEWLRTRIGGGKAIINREVQVNARTSQSADRTDVLIQATSQGADPLSVVVEVKGAWNKDLMTAMDNQLAARYLKPDLTDQGVYLVIWFAADGWDDYGNANERARRARSTRHDATALSALLSKQATEVSTARNVTIDSLVIDGSVDWPKPSSA